MNVEWKRTTLGDICEFRGGGTPSKAIKRYWQGGIPWVSPKDMKADVIADSEDHVSEEAVANSATSLIPKRSVLIVVRSGILARTVPLAITDCEVTVNQDIKALCPGKCLDSKFLFYFLRSRMTQLLSHVTRGATVHRLATNDIKALEIAVPSLVEQKRIVAKIDQAFEAMDTAQRNVEKNVRNAKELFESSVAAAVLEAQQESETVLLSELATDITDGDHQPPPKANAGIPFVTIGNIDKGSRTLDLSDTFLVPKSYFDGLKGNRKPNYGDVLYTVTGSFGIPVLVETKQPFCFQRHIALVRPSQDVDSEWLNYLLGSPQVFRQADASATGAAQRTVSLKSLRGFRVPKVGIAKQRMFAQRLKEIRRHTQRLIAVYNAERSRLDALRSSLLSHAFSGNL